MDNEVLWNFLKFMIGFCFYLYGNNNLGVSIVFVVDCNDDVDLEVVFG